VEVDEPDAADEGGNPDQVADVRVAVESMVGSAGRSKGKGDDPTHLPSVPHTFSHLHVTYHPVLLRVRLGTDAPGDARWFTFDEVETLPLPVAQQSIVRCVREVLDGAS